MPAVRIGHAAAMLQAMIGPVRTAGAGTGGAALSTVAGSPERAYCGPVGPERVSGRQDRSGPDGGGDPAAAARPNVSNRTGCATMTPATNSGMMIR